MSTPEQRKRYKTYSERHEAIFAEWRERGYRYPPPKSEPLPSDLIGLTCGAKTRAGTPCKLTSIYSGRQKAFGAERTLPETKAES